MVRSSALQLCHRPQAGRLRRRRLGKTKTGRLWIHLVMSARMPDRHRPLCSTGAICYARSRWDALTAYVNEGRLEISNSAAENAIRPVTFGRKNWLFATSDAGGDTAAIFDTLIRSAKLNGLEPEAWLRGILTRIGEHPINRLAELLPWNMAR